MKKYNNFSFDENRKNLRKYINILKNSDIKDPNLEHYTDYLIIIHNFLLLEEAFKNVIKQSNKEINKHLDLKELKNAEDILELSKKLYEPNDIVRLNMETLDSIEEVRLYLQKVNADFYNKIYFKLPE